MICGFFCFTIGINGTGCSCTSGFVLSSLDSNCYSPCLSPSDSLYTTGNSLVAHYSFSGTLINSINYTVWSNGVSIGSASTYSPGGPNGQSVFITTSSYVTASVGSLADFTYSFW